MKLQWTRVLQIAVMLCMLQWAYILLHATPAHTFVLTLLFSTLFFFMVGPLFGDDDPDKGDDS